MHLSLATSCGIVMLSFGPEPWSYAHHRVAETMLGIGVACSINLVPELVRIDESGHHDE